MGKIKEINLNELPKYSDWATRCLGLRKFQQQIRTIKKIDNEYDKDKYAKCLSYYLESPRCSISDIRKFEVWRGRCDKEVRLNMCISKKDKLFLVPFDKIMKMWKDLLFNALKDSLNGEDIVIELGCGYGYNLWLLDSIFPNKTFLGGEYSMNAVTLANRLFEKYKNILVVPFNYYDTVWKICERITKKAVVFTSHSIEQLPVAKPVLKNFVKNKDKIKEVIHLEPTFELYDDSTLLGLMRKKYTLINDYNKDLISSLKSYNVRYMKLEPCVFGVNPLNPTSIIRWKF